MWVEVETARKEKRHELVLSGSNVNARLLKSGIDTAIFDLLALNYLNISETSLTHVPDSINKLVNLQTLVLHSNKLEQINEKIASLEKLKILDLSRNALTEIPASFAGLLQLVTLNASSNKLEECSLSFTKNTKLTVIDLSNNKIKSFPDVCHEELACLAELKLNSNEIAEIPAGLVKLPMLKLLDVSSNKVKVLPGELADCLKLKELNLKQNPVSDRRLLKLIDQSRTTKQVVDYIKLHCPKVNIADAAGNNNKKGKSKAKLSESSNEDDVPAKYTINVKFAKEDFYVTVLNSVQTVREHILCCLVNNLAFNADSFKKFIQLQNKLHDTVCNKRQTATIATHDFNKIAPGNLVYTTALPNELIIKPLNRTTNMTGTELFDKLQTEANNLRKEKKRNTYSGIHKYLSLLEGKPRYPCLLNVNHEVLSFPPITNSDISKIDVNTKAILVEVTSSLGQSSCKMVLDALLKEMVNLFEVIEVQQVKTVDDNEQLKAVYPSKTDLIYEARFGIKVVRD